MVKYLDRIILRTSDVEAMNISEGENRIIEGVVTLRYR